MSLKQKCLSVLVVAGASLTGGVVEGRDPGQKYFATGSLPPVDGAPEYFTGQVQVKPLFSANETADYSGAYVSFSPAARTAWHEHPGGQHMVVISGAALTGTRDGKVFRVEAGDALWCPAGIDHWHGATPDAAMTHLVITGRRGGEVVVWKEHVDDETYAQAAEPRYPSSE